MPILNEALFDERLEQLERARAWSPRVISKLESFIRSADDHALFRIDPLLYAAEKGMSEEEAIDLFLYAAKLSLFDIEWNLICACCGQVFTSLRSLSALHAHFVCSVCRMENHANLDDLIQISFTIAPAIRNNVYFTPDKLSAEDYVFRYRFMQAGIREPNLGTNPDYFHRYTRVITYLDPGEVLSLEVEVTPGLVFGGDMLQGSIFTFFGVPASDGGGPQPVRVRFALPDMQVHEPETHPEQTQIQTAHGEQQFEFPHFAPVVAGRSQWTLENHLPERVCVWIVDLPEDVTSTWLRIPSFLSGKRLLTTQTFRNLYRSEVIDDNEGLGVRDITFLFTDLKGSTALYDQLGDLKAYHLVRQHFNALDKVVVRHSGATVKTIGDEVMATFCTPLEGIRAAMDILETIDTFNQGRTEQLILKIGLHTGHSIAVTLNERLDYFGQTVNIASRVQEQAEANEIYISQDVYAYPGVSDIIGQCTVTPAQVSVKGVSCMLQLYRIRSRVKEEELVSN